MHYRSSQREQTSQSQHNRTGGGNNMQIYYQKSEFKNEKEKYSLDMI